MGQHYFLVFLLLLGAFTAALGNEEEFERGEGRISDDFHDTVQQRIQKVLPIFQVVRFPNSVCSGGTRNGTCYTSEECSSRGGSSSGTCASGFGVCCVFTLSCGQTTSENCSYLVQSSTTSLTSPCTYTVCKCSSNVCRIRFDFTTHVLADPVLGTAHPTAGTETDYAKAGSIGDCITDSFGITAPGSVGSPLICGFNTGQHMIVDASDACHAANFNIGGSTGTSRQWDIKVTQFACGDNNALGGPPGCLQYFTGSTGMIASYNFPTTATSIGLTATHLSNQCYEMCIRRSSGMCYICYTPSISGVAEKQAIQNSFGLGVSGNAAISHGVYNTDCSLDYLVIPGGMTAANAAISTTIALNTNRICGRFFNPAGTPGLAAAIQITNISICTRSVPFRLTFKSDSNENTITALTAANAVIATANEGDLTPSGYVGFKLNYVQHSC